MSTVHDHPQTAKAHHVGTDVPFFTCLCVLGGVYVALIVAMLVADAAFTSPRHLLGALASPEIRVAIQLRFIRLKRTWSGG